METIIAILLLLLPSIILGIKNNAEYGSVPSFGVAQKSLILLLTSYIFTIIFLGAEQVQGESNLQFSFNLRKFGVFFVFPGVGVAIILFPKIAAEYLGNHYNLASSSALEMFSVVGWSILFLSVLSALIWY